METPSTKKEKVIIIPRPPRSANAETAPDDVPATAEAEEMEKPSAPVNNPAGNPTAHGASAEVPVEEE